MSATSSLTENLDKREKLQAQLQDLEKQIYDLETHYLEETMNTGNIIKGWDSYFTNKNPQKQLPNMQLKRPKIAPNDRIFSLSSTTSPAQDKVAEVQDKNMDHPIGINLQNRSKRIKKKQKYDKLHRPGINDSPQRAYEQDSDQGEDQFEEDNSNDDELIDENLSKSPTKKKKIKKSKKGKMGKNKGI